MDGDDVSGWSERVEDLVDDGSIDEAITLLESVVSKIETLDPLESRLQLSSALLELAGLYSLKGFSIKADETRSRAIFLRESGGKVSKESLDLADKASAVVGSSDVGYKRESLESTNEAAPGKEFSDDDWEAIADCAPDELLPSQCSSGAAKLSVEDKQVQTPRQRGRGIFSNRKPGLYSDQQCDDTVIYDSDSEEGTACYSSRQDSENEKLHYGTRHVLALEGFPPSTKTTDLEKLLEKFKDHGVAIRWVNDTAALAVFRTPSAALEAWNSIRCPFTVRVLDEDDVLLGSIKQRDLEPSRQRPQTSARTAQRLIAQVMGLKLPSATYGAAEHRKEEAARRKRIVTRQQMRDDAWGEDAN